MFDVHLRTSRAKNGSTHRSERDQEASQQHEHKIHFVFFNCVCVFSSLLVFLQVITDL